MASGNPYFTGINQTLEEYIPMPMDMLLKAGQAVQGRYDQSIADDSAMETGLASIQAKAPAYREYVNNMLNSYKADSSALIDKYGGKLENPEFIREQKKLINKYKNDPNWSTITEGNKAIERSQELEAKLKAEGKLFISPLASFTGRDATGNLLAYQGSPEGVNTLDEWTKAGAIAHQSTEDIGGKTTNRRNLDRWRQTLASDTAGQQRLQQAYMQRGMSEKEAKAAVATSIQGLINQYGVDEKINMGLLNYQLGLRRLAADEADRAERRRAAQVKTTKPAPTVITPTFSQYAGGSQAIAKAGNHSVYGTGESMNGTRNVPIKNQTVSGKVWVVDSDGSAIVKPQNTSVKVNSGVLTGYKNVLVNKKTGELITSNGKLKTSKDKNGNTVVFYKGKPESVEERTVAVYETNDKTKDNQSRTILRMATRDEALREMGVTGAAYEGKTKISARDFPSDFLGSFSPEDRKMNQDALNRVIKGTASPEDYQRAKDLKTLLDHQYYTQPGGIFEQFMNQGKRSNITGKPGTYAGDSEFNEDRIDIEEE